MRGETVTVAFREEKGRDEFNNVVYEGIEEEVENVLVTPGEPADVIESTRPEGTDVSYTLYFPKTFSGDLECGKVKVRGEWFDVIGHPDRFEESVCPTEWCMTVKVGKIHG